jgi:hypothetical protein
MSDETKGFCITSGRGFHITFPNGMTVSVQFGPYNYCPNREESFASDEEAGANGCDEAEVAVIRRDGTMLRLSEHDTVRGWVNPTGVLEIMKIAEKLPSDGEWPKPKKKKKLTMESLEKIAKRNVAEAKRCKS